MIGFLFLSLQLITNIFAYIYSISPLSPNLQLSAAVLQCHTLVTINAIEEDITWCPKIMCMLRVRARASCLCVYFHIVWLSVQCSHSFTSVCIKCKQPEMSEESVINSKHTHLIKGHVRQRQSRWAELLILGAQTPSHFNVIWPPVFGSSKR